MYLSNPFTSFAFGDIFNTVLPDFILAFAFFTAIVYAVRPCVGEPHMLRLETLLGTARPTRPQAGKDLR